MSFVLPLFGYLIGARLVLASRAWDGRDKRIALLVSPFAVLAGAIVVLVAVSGGDSTGALGPVEIAVLAVDVLSGLIAAAYLSSRLPRS